MPDRAEYFSEEDTRAKLIDPALHARGWMEDLIKREETRGMVEVGADGKPRRKKRGRTDYILRIRIARDTQPVAVALIEAKASDKAPVHGLEQGKRYAEKAQRLNVSFVFSSNGHRFVEYDRTTGLTSDPKPMHEFPSPAELRERYERAMGFTLESPQATPLLARYPGGEATRRYYQDAAIRAALEKIARGENRILLSLATGAGKTFIAVNLLRRIAEAKQLKRALFICDRDELRTQALTAFQNNFGTDAQAVSRNNPEKNARIIIATYQTLGVSGDTEDDEHATFFTDNYPENYFSHIVIDECHRSAWGKWSQVLTRNPNAIQIGLTATPREIVQKILDKKISEDKITPDNLTYFGDPVYEYGIDQGIEDGYLAAMLVHRFDLFHDNKEANERETVTTKEDLKDKVLRDAITGDLLTVEEAREQYGADAIESRIRMPDRVKRMTEDLFDHLLATGVPEQKTIIFCARDQHADDVASAMNNLYAAWCAKQKDISPPPDGRGSERGWGAANPYAFKCTASVGGQDTIGDFKALQRHYLIATTVDLLSTGVDVPNVRNIVFFRYLKSSIVFHQMVGRGTRIDEPSGKLMFRVYDYTDATRLFGKPYDTPPPRSGGDGDGPPPPPERILEVEGIEVKITDAGTLVTVQEDGKPKLIPFEEYRQRVAAKLTESAPTLDDFRERWTDPAARRELLNDLPNGGSSLHVVQQIGGLDAYDQYDVLAELGYGLAAKTRQDRAESFMYKHEKWLAMLPPETAAAIRALAMQFRRNGTEELESRYVFETPEFLHAGGLDALKKSGDPAKLLREVKGKMFEG